MIELVLRTMSPPTDTTELAVNDRCLNLLPFRGLATNDLDQPNAGPQPGPTSDPNLLAAAIAATLAWQSPHPSATDAQQLLN